MSTSPPISSSTPSSPPTTTAAPPPAKTPTAASHPTPRRRLLRSALTRLLSSLGVMWAAVTVVFVLSRASGDPVAQLLPEDADPAQVAQMQAALGLDRPLIVQYLDFLGGLVRLDLGDSLLYHEPVTSLLLERVPATVLLAFSALLITVVVAFLAGSIAAMRRGTGVDRAVMGAVLVGQSTPAFWVGILLVLLFGVQLRILPAAGYGTLAHLVLPATTLAIFSVAVVARLLRSSLIEVMGQDHVRTARAKGAGEIRVLLGHSLRNASVPVITVLGLEFGALLGGAILTEQIFNWPGLGRLTIDAISFRDFPLVQGTVVLFAATFIVVNLLVDLSYAVIDPRVRTDA
ncbi:ABC transporter permease [Brachybacterium tyrofermentans]|uniref:ABC transporter permease n=1 Tax=Brachybacterium tyrofermentans TaxID=47848 RepID=UPI003FCF6CA8